MDGLYFDNFVMFFVFKFGDVVFVGVFDLFFYELLVLEVVGWLGLV